MIHTAMGHGLGWRRQKPDHRDHLFAAPPVAIPPYVDLRKLGFLPPVYDQGQLGSCTANAIAAALQFERAKQKLPDVGRLPSRLMIYYDERVIENTVESDAGAEIRDGIKSVAAHGVCFEDGPNGWSYDIARFTERPPQACYDNAVRHKALSYFSVPQLDRQIRGCLAAGWPVVFGFSCFDAIDTPEVARSGRLPLPGPGDAVIGGHAVMLVGYDDAGRNFLVRNSWGNWGIQGNFLMPYEYVLRSDLSSDFWTVRLVS